MRKVPIDKTVDLFFNAGPGYFRCRVLHPHESELVDIQTPYLVISAPLRRYTVNLSDVTRSLECESAERLFDDIALSQLTTYVIQSEGLQHGNIVLWEMECLLDAGGSGKIAETGYGPCPRAGRWTLGRVGGPCRQKV